MKWWDSLLGVLVAAGSNRCKLVMTSFGMCRLREWLEAVLWEGGSGLGEVYRLKGVVEVEGSSRLHIVQAVRELYDINEGPELSADDCLKARLVLIGRDLQRGSLLDSFQSTVRDLLENRTDRDSSQRT